MKRIEQGLCVPKIISKRCELVKLCHINYSIWFFWSQCIFKKIGKEWTDFNANWHNCCTWQGHKTI